MSHTITGQGNPSTFRDIHYLDGQLFKYNISNNLNKEEKQKIIICLIDVVKERVNPEIKEHAIQALHTISNDVGTSSNFSSPDNLKAEDILIAIANSLIEIKDNEVINTAMNNLGEQMSDMVRTSGWCPQGRCTRLWNVYMILRDYLDGVYLPPN
jgi:hypothetical protein